jgi:hypothetical protein
MIGRGKKVTRCGKTSGNSYNLWWAELIKPSRFLGVDV